MAHPATRDGHLQRLAESKPSQADLDTATRVLRWLSDHAHFFPEEYGENASEHLAKAANDCAVDAGELLLTEADYAERDAHNHRVTTEDADT